jgi:ATP-dependent helicase/nuclease subunit A
VDLVSLAQLSIVRDLMALTQALDHEADRTAWFAILRAPWCGLTLTQISTLVGTDRHATVWERICDGEVLAALAPEARLRVGRLHAALAASGHTDPARRVETAWLLLGGPAACARQTDLRHARAFFDALAQWSQEPDWTGPQELPERLNRLFASHEAGSAGTVQVMTIHRAKGLEFDHVILPGLGRRRRRNERQLLQWLDLPRGTHGSDLLMVAVPPAAATGPTALGRYVSQLQNQREQNEATRLLYVAATRARLQLHLFGQLDAPVAGQPEPRPGAGTLLERLWPAVKDQFPSHSEGSVTTAPPDPQATIRGPAALERLGADWRLPPLPPGPEPEAVPIASYEPLQSLAPQAADLVDRAVCEVLRSQARRRGPLGDDAQLLTQVTLRLQRLGCAADTLRERARLGLELLQACRQDSRLQWIFANLGAAEARPEVPLALTGMFAGRLTSIQADLSFTDQAGTRWLIDIAPTPPADEAAPEAAFALRLTRNVHLAAALDAAPARAAVYLPATRLFWAGP